MLWQIYYKIIHILNIDYFYPLCYCGERYCFLTHVFLGILSSLQTIIAEQFSTNIITRLAIKLTKVKNLNFFENKDHTIKLNAIHNGLYIRPLNYVSNLF